MGGYILCSVCGQMKTRSMVVENCLGEIVCFDYADHICASAGNRAAELSEYLARKSECACSMLSLIYCDSDIKQSATYRSLMRINAADLEALSGLESAGYLHRIGAVLPEKGEGI